MKFAGLLAALLLVSGASAQMQKAPGRHAIFARANAPQNAEDMAKVYDPERRASHTHLRKSHSC